VEAAGARAETPHIRQAHHAELRRGRFGTEGE